MPIRSKGWRVALTVTVVLASHNAFALPKHAAPVPGATLSLMEGKELSLASPILVRAFKKEAELEIWKQGKDGRFVHLKTFPICRWSGQLGPKTAQGDRQVPEGFYAITPAQMNPNSSFHLSFDIGYPNAYDRAHGGSGAYLMVHGACSSSGCFAMTDKAVSEIYAIAREAFAGGQQAFQFQSFPFRMSAENLAKHRSDKHIDFWRQLKEGSDRFEAIGEAPVVGVSSGRYVFAPSKDVAKEALVKARRAREEAAITAIGRKKPAVITTYVDGGQHKSFQAQMKRGRLGAVSQPDALPHAGREMVIGGAPKADNAGAKAPDQPSPKRSATKASVARARAPASAPVPERPLFQRLFDVLKPGPTSASGGGST